MRTPYHLPLVAAICLCLPAFSGCAGAPEPSSDESELRRLHEQLIHAHLAGDVDAWMAVEADTTVSANGGRVTFQPAAERRSGRSTYLDNATFERYRDIREPIIRISDDGSLGWLIAEVEVVGSVRDSDGSTGEFATAWAWVELYERTGDGWKLVGNVSNSRPLE